MVHGFLGFGFMDALTGVLDTAVTSPWFYLALFVVAALDGFFPVVPSESMVITGVCTRRRGSRSWSWWWCWRRWARSSVIMCRI